MTQDAKITEHKDGTVTVVTTKGKRHHGVAMVLDTDDVLREQVGGFANFLQEYAVIGLALGFIVGQPANNVVKAFVDGFINPWVTILFGQDLSSRAATLHHGTTPVKVPWGGFVYALIEFVVVLIIIYVAIKFFKLNRFIKGNNKK